MFIQVENHENTSRLFRFRVNAITARINNDMTRWTNWDATTIDFHKNEGFHCDTEIMKNRILINFERD